MTVIIIPPPDRLADQTWLCKPVGESCRLRHSPAEVFLRRNQGSSPHPEQLVSNTNILLPITMLLLAQGLWGRARCMTAGQVPQSPTVPFIGTSRIEHASGDLREKGHPQSSRN